MTFQYLTEDNLGDKYNDAKQYMLLLTKPFQEFERIANNQPSTNRDTRYSDVTDGTTASVVRKVGKRIVQQIPTGRVIADNDTDWLPIVADFILTHKIIPEANLDFDFIQKCWSVIEKGATFGSIATYTPFVNHAGYFCTDLTLPYWADVYLPRGYKSGYEAPFVFIRTWWQADDIDAIIDQEEQLQEQAKKRKDKYESTWDIDGLKSIRDSLSDKTFLDQTPSERNRGTNPEGVEVVTGFQDGLNASFYTFCPTQGNDQNSEDFTIVRRKVNKDPRGKKPVDFFYFDTDGFNPLGRGVVELIGPLQNLIDTDMAMYQWNRALSLAPPVVTFDIASKSMVYAPNAIIKGRSPNAKATPLDIDTTAIASYPSLYGLQKSQLLNLVNSPDTSIGSDIGNPGFGKTPQALQQQQAVISVDDNYVRKNFEAWFEHWAETAVNIYFGERTGKEILQLDIETAKRLRELPGFDPSLLSKDNELTIDYDVETPALRFRVNPSTTQVKDAATQVQDASNLLDMVMKYPMLNSNYGGPIDTEVLARRIVINSGIDDPEQVAPEPTEEQKQSKEAAKHQVNPFSPMFDKPSIKLDYVDLPPAAQVQVLANAGVQVTTDDVMQGAVLDPNARGNAALQPMSDPNVLLPGQQPGQAATMANPVDIGDIYKQTTDPTVKAQIEQMAGLSPSTVHVATQMAGNVAKALPAQAAPTPQADDQAEAAEPSPDTEDAHDQVSDQLTEQLQQLGVPTKLIVKAHQMAEKGYSSDDILAAIQGALSHAG